MPISAPRPECTTDPECPDHLACIQERCQDPCTTLACGINAQCSVSNHRATCTCRRGFIGDPFTVCRERKLPLAHPPLQVYFIDFSHSWLPGRFRVWPCPCLLRQRMPRPLPVWELWGECHLQCQESSWLLHLQTQPHWQPLWLLQTLWMPCGPRLPHHTEVWKWEMFILFGDYGIKEFV